MRGEAPEAALEKLQDYFDGMLDDISDAGKKKIGRKIGQTLRRAQSARIAANTQPDGSAMAKRKKRLQRKGKKKPRTGKMFREIRKARNLKIVPSSEGVELRFKNRNIERTAAEHHYGLEGFVGKTRDKRVIRTRYTARRLLGFAPDDLEEMTETLLDWLDREQ